MASSSHLKSRCERNVLFNIISGHVGIGTNCVISHTWKAAAESGCFACCTPFLPPHRASPKCIQVSPRGHGVLRSSLALLCPGIYSCLKVKLNNPFISVTGKKKKRLMKSRKLKMRFHYVF